MRVCVFVESKFDVEYGCVMKLTLTHRHHQPSPSFTSLVKQRIESLRSDRNRFFARLENGGDIALPTHQQIQWEDTILILTGTPVARTAPTPPSEVNPAPPAAPTNE